MNHASEPPRSDLFLMSTLAAMLSTAASRLARALARPEHLAGDRAIGARGEREAAKFLRRAGYQIKGRNLRLSAGEIDLLCTDPDHRTIVVVEVKSRVRTGQPGSSRVNPEAAVTAHKRAKLASLTRTLRRANGWEDRPVRIDVVAVELSPDGREAQVRHFIDAVRW